MTNAPRMGSLLPLVHLLRLKAALGESIHWRGLNAKQIEALQSVPDWPAVHRSYAKWRHHDLGYGRLPWGWLSITLLALVGWYIADGWLLSVSRGVAQVAGLLTVIEVGRREGHREGYVDGYSAGHEAGCNRALGLSDEDARAVGEMAGEMELDAFHVRAVTRAPERDGE